MIIAKKKSKKIKKRNWVQQMHIEQNRKSGAHKDKSKYTRKKKHRDRHD